MTLTKQQQEIINELRDTGAAVVILGTGKLRGCDPDYIEGIMIDSGLAAIEESEVNEATGLEL